MTGSASELTDNTKRGADPSTPFHASLRGLDLNQRPLGYETGGLVPSLPSGAVSCRPGRGSCRPVPPRAAEVRMVRLQMVCTKSSNEGLSTWVGDSLGLSAGPFVAPPSAVGRSTPPVAIQGAMKPQATPASSPATRPENLDGLTLRGGRPITAADSP